MRPQPRGDDRRRPAVLFFGNDWQAENRTSSHQIAIRLASKYRVYYVECPGLRAPAGTGRDVRKVIRKLGRSLRGRTRLSEGLTVLTLLQLPFHSHRLVRLCNRAIVRATIWWLRKTERIERPITWFMIPHVPSLVGTLGERVSVYYCIDDYASLQGVDPQAVRAMDEETTRRADVVFVASETLIAAKRALNDDVVLSPHGVDYAHFSRVQSEAMPPPEDVARLPHPLVGFFGLIERRIDLELVDYLARMRPAWSFVLLGRVAVPPGDMPRQPNVYLLGPRPYSALPAYARQFDVAMIPYRLIPETYHANPAKLREYLATGRPVVSVSNPEIDKFSDVIRIGRSREELLAHLDQLIAHGEPYEAVTRRMNLAAACSWDLRVAEIAAMVEARAGERIAAFALRATAPKGAFARSGRRRASQPPFGSA